MLDDAHFAAIADAAPFPMWRADCSGRCTLLNRAWVELTGQTAFEGQGDGWQAVIHPDDLATAQLAFVAAQARGLPYQVEYRVRRSNGQYAWMVDSATPRYDAAGTLLGYIGSLIEITDRKAAEELLERTERRLTIATEAAGIGIWEWNLDTDTFSLTPRAIEIYGLQEKDSFTRDEIKAAVHPDDVDILLAHSRQALDPQIRLTEPYLYRIVRPSDGQLRWIRAHAEATFDESIPKAISYIGTFEDVTDAHLARQELEDSEARLKMALDAGDLVLWELDLANNELTHSPKLNLLFGLPAESRPTPEDLHELYAPGEKERLDQLGQEATARGETAIATELNFRRPDGIERWAFLRAQAAPPTSRSGPRAIGVLLDITDRKRHEQRLEAITGEVQHRLKNVLAIIQSLAKQTFKDTAHKRPLDEFLGRLHAFAAATDALRSEQGNAAEVQALVEEALKPFRQSHSAQIEISGPRVAVDAQNALSVSMTFHELSTNAVKYGALSSPSGQVRITWYPRDEQIVFQWRELGGPPVMAPEVTGFGSRLIRGLFPQNSIDVRYPERGVECDFAVPKKTSALT